MLKQLYPLILVVLVPLVGTAQERPKVEFRDGERIALVGNEFFEGEQDRGYIETQLTSRFPDKNLIFRNLGYSGDTVWADARSLCAGWDNFGPPDQGFNRLTSLVREIKPTLIFVAYGMNESFDGPKGVDHFATGLERMLEMLSSASGAARVALISPIRHENLGPPLPDPAEHNKNIRLYIDAMRQVAEKRGYVLIDLYETLGDGTKRSPPVPFTSDGIHLTPYGYWRAAQIIERAMGFAPRVWRVNLNAATGKLDAEGTTIDHVQASSKRVSFRATDSVLPVTSAPEDAPSLVGSERMLTVAGLALSSYVLKSGDQTIANGTAEQWAKGIQLGSGPEFDQEERLRSAVVAKNFDFFNYWRPENDTYILGYRKHEQGRNAVEIPRFGPLVETKESEIAKLRVPVSHTYVLTRQAGQ